MKPSFIRRVLVSSLLLSIPAFLLGFGIAYRQDEIHVFNVGHLAWLHFSYAEELKDDMAVIDWAKNLENLDTVRAFQVVSGPNIIAEGGNRNYLPSITPEGVAYLFPAGWTFRVTSTKPQAPTLEFTLVLHAWPGPLLWGMLLFGVCLAGGCALGYFSFRPLPVKILPNETIRSASPVTSLKNQIPTKSIPIPPQNKKAYFFIDKDYVIRQASQEAAGYFKKKPEELLNRHLLDLAPDPALVQAFEKKEETKIPKPFLEPLDISAHLKPEAGGCLVILERSSGPQTL